MQQVDAKSDYRAHFDRTYGRRGYSFSRYLPAYRYGAWLARQPRLADRTWHSIEADARREWESRDARPWEDFCHAVRYGWLISKANARRAK